MVSALTCWVVASILLYQGCSYLVWALTSQSQPWQETWRARLEQPAVYEWLKRAGPGLRQVGRFLFYIGIPYLALIQGVVSPRTLGLQGPLVPAAGPAGPGELLAGVLTLDWVRATGAGSLLAVGAGVMLALIWWRYQRITGNLPLRSEPGNVAEEKPTERWPLRASLAALQRPWGWAGLLLDAIYLEVHWAFYRAWTLDLLRGDPAGATMGAVLGLVPVGLEWYGDVRLRARLRTLAGVEEWAFVASLAFVSTFIFIFIGNLWVLMVIHWLIAWGVLAFLGRQRRRAASRSATLHTPDAPSRS